MVNWSNKNKYKVQNLRYIYRGSLFIKVREGPQDHEDDRA